jgi:hypothetical protein
LRYKVLGLIIDSDTTLSGLEPWDECQPPTPSVTLRQVPPVDSTDLAKWRLFRRVLADPRGKYWSMYEGESRYLLEYDGLLQFSISRDGNSIEYSLNRDNLDQFFQWTVLHLVLLFVLHLRSVPVYHAGGVSVDGKALLFFGHSGQGKSTLSASFGKAGYPVITDDVLVLEEDEQGFSALPSFPWVRLCRESIDAVFGINALEFLSADGDGKLRVSPDSGLMPFAAGPSPVKGIYVLSNGDGLLSSQIVEISLIPRAEAIGILLSRNSMLPVLGRDQVAYVLGFLNRLVTQIPVWHLRINPGLEQLPQVVEAIVKHEPISRPLSAMSRLGCRV